MNGPYPVLDVADWFCGSIDRENGDSITHLKLHKLVYYAQAWSLALLDRPLIDSHLEAWRHGPASPQVYAIHRNYTTGEYLPPPENIPTFDEKSQILLKAVLDVYGDMSGHHLKQLTHEEMPWKSAWGNRSEDDRSNEVITHQSMKEFYSDPRHHNEEAVRFIDCLNDNLDIDDAMREISSGESCSLEDALKEIL